MSAARLVGDVFRKLFGERRDDNDNSRTVVSDAVVEVDRQAILPKADDVCVNHMNDETTSSVAPDDNHNVQHLQEEEEDQRPGGNSSSLQRLSQDAALGRDGEYANAGRTGQTCLLGGHDKKTLTGLLPEYSSVVEPSGTGCGERVCCCDRCRKSTSSNRGYLAAANEPAYVQLLPRTKHGPPPSYADVVSRSSRTFATNDDDRDKDSPTSTSDLTRISTGGSTTLSAGRSTVNVSKIPRTEPVMVLSTKQSSSSSSSITSKRFVPGSEAALSSLPSETALASSLPQSVAASLDGEEGYSESQRRLAAHRKTFADTTQKTIVAPNRTICHIDS